MSIDIAQAIAKSSPPVSLAGKKSGSLILTWMRRAQQRRDLSALTDREMADMGLTDHQVAAEAAKPFWQA